MRITTVLISPEPGASQRRDIQHDQLRLRDFNDIITSGKAPGKIALVTPDGEAREVADELAFPNGMVVTPDNRTLIVAESFAARLTRNGPSQR